MVGTLLNTSNIKTQPLEPFGQAMPYVERDEQVAFLVWQTVVLSSAPPDQYVCRTRTVLQGNNLGQWSYAHKSLICLTPPPHRGS